MTRDISKSLTLKRGFFQNKFRVPDQKVTRIPYTDSAVPDRPVRIIQADPKRNFPQMPNFGTLSYVNDRILQVAYVYVRLSPVNEYKEIPFYGLRSLTSNVTSLIGQNITESPVKKKQKIIVEML